MSGVDRTGARALLGRAALALAVSAAFGLVITTPTLSRPVVVVIDNLGQLAAASLAALACAAAARRSGPGARRAWWLLAAGAASWALGQGAWSYHELVARREVPFPSPGDVAFLLCPLLSTAGLLCWLSAGGPTTRLKDVFDGAIIATSLLTLSWVTVIEALHTAGGQGPLPAVLSYASPVGDIVVTTLALLTMARSSGALRPVLLLVAAGVGALAVADSAYAFLDATGDYATGDVISVGWVLGFAWIAVGARAAVRPQAPAAAPPQGGREEERPSTRVRLVLPYLPMLAAVGTVAAHALSPRGVSATGVLLTGALVLLVMGRQFTALADIRRLVMELSAARDQMRHLALHDPLTGLANRGLFRDRVEHALALRPGVASSMAVVYCDLDGFKAVNDTGGHAVGDALLCTVAERMRSVLRPADTVARLGGDEFAVLLEDPSDPVEVAQRLLAAVSQPCTLGGLAVHVTMSVGVAVYEHSSPEPETEASLLARADAAMYRAKADGKGQVVAAGEPLTRATGASSGSPAPLGRGRGPATAG